MLIRSGGGGAFFRLTSLDAANDARPTFRSIDVFGANQVRNSAPGPNGKCGKITAGNRMVHSRMRCGGFRFYYVANCEERKKERGEAEHIYFPNL